MEAEAQLIVASLLRAIALASPTAGTIILVVSVGLVGFGFVWHRLAPLRDRVRRANDENDIRQRKDARVTSAHDD
jgi:hypothetical protein